MIVLDDKVACGTPIILYGGAGIGKSTLASQAPKPVFADVENGLRRIPGVAKTPVITTWDHFQKVCGEYIKSDFKTLVVDTLDVLEQLLHQHLCKVNGWKNMEAPGYGKGYMIASEHWMKFCSFIDDVINADKNIILIAHECIKPYQAPDQDVYDRYNIKINKNASNILIAKVDAVLFAQTEVVVREDKTKEDRVRAVGTGKRVLRTQETPAYIAKNRFDLKQTEPFDSTIFEKLLFQKKHRHPQQELKMRRFIKISTPGESTFFVLNVDSIICAKTLDAITLEIHLADNTTIEVIGTEESFLQVLNECEGN